MLKQALCILILAGCAQAQAASVYKWTDEQGQMHYSSTPPPTGEYETIGKPTPEATAPAPRAAVKNASEEKQPMEDPEVKTELERMAQNCEITKTNLEKLENKNVKIQIIDKDGHRVPLDEKQRQEAIERNRRDMEQYCNASNAANPPDESAAP